MSKFVKLSRVEMKSVLGGLRDPGDGSSGCGEKCSGSCTVKSGLCKGKTGTCGLTEGSCACAAVCSE